MDISYCIVLCTCPNQEIAQSIANNITDSRLVACTNIVPHLTSIYFWDGKVKQGNEVLLMMKTRKEKLSDLEKAILAMHPYEFPEFIALPIMYGNRDYLQWVDEVVTPS